MDIRLRQKRAELGHQHEKKHWISTIHVCLILGPLSCAKLTFIFKSDFISSVGGTWGQICQMGNCFDLIERLRFSAFSTQVSFMHQYFLYCFPRRVFSTDYIPPPPRMSAKGWTQTSVAGPPSILAWRTEGSAEMNRDSPPPCPTAPHEIGPLLLAWQLYFHVREHLSLWCIYELLHSCFRGSKTHRRLLYDSCLSP